MYRLRCFFLGHLWCSRLVNNFWFNQCSRCGKITHDLDKTHPQDRQTEYNA